MIVRATFEMVDAAGIVESARKDRVTIKPSDVIFVADGVRAVACVRMIGHGRNRGRLARLCGCWVAKEYRGRGIGRDLVAARLRFIREDTAAAAVDTYAFSSRLFLSLGFEKRTSYKIGTTLLRLVIQR